MMSSTEDEPSSSLNGRLRPRKANVLSPQSKSSRRFEGKSLDRPKRTTTPSKSTPSKAGDLATKNDFSLLLLCPYCDLRFATKQTLSKHCRQLHLHTPLTNTETRAQTLATCLYCAHEENDPPRILQHMIDAHPNQYFACLNCNTRFNSSADLETHKLDYCEKPKISNRIKLRKSIKKKPKTQTGKNSSTDDKDFAGGFNGVVISCELKPKHVRDEADIEDNITTNVIVPHTKNISDKSVLEKNAVIVLDDIQWNKRMPPNFTFHNTDADQILSRLGVVHKSPRGEPTKKEWIKLVDNNSQCFDTNFYAKVASNVQENLAKFLDGSFNFIPDPDSMIKTRKSKNSINTAEGFPILLACEQYSRNIFEGYMPRAIAPRHKWKWGNLENDKNQLSLDQLKRDSHTNSCIITLVSSLDIWTQLCMRRKFENKFKKSVVEKKTEKQNALGKELKEILESREIPTTSSQVVRPIPRSVPSVAISEFPASLGLAPALPKYDVPPAILSGEWVRPRCYVCCACGAQNCDSRGLASHMATVHPNAQVQHYEIVGELLLNADILKHLYVPPAQNSVNRTRPLRGIRECTKCKKPTSLEDLHQHMLDCAGDTPAVRRKCRYRPFGVRKRRPRVPDNTIRKKIRKDVQSRHSQQKNIIRPRPKAKSDVGDAETIRKMLAGLPEKRHRVLVNPLNAANSSRHKVNTQRQIIRKKTTSDVVKRTLRKKANTKVPKTTVDIISDFEQNADNNVNNINGTGPNTNDSAQVLNDFEQISIDNLHASNENSDETLQSSNKMPEFAIDSNETKNTKDINDKSDIPVVSFNETTLKSNDLIDECDEAKQVSNDEEDSKPLNARNKLLPKRNTRRKQNAQKRVDHTRPKRKLILIDNSQDLDKPPNQHSLPNPDSTNQDEFSSSSDPQRIDVNNGPFDAREHSSGGGGGGDGGGRGGGGSSDGGGRSRDCNGGGTGGDAGSNGGGGGVSSSGGGGLSGGGAGAGGGGNDDGFNNRDRPHSKASPKKNKQQENNAGSESSNNVPLKHSIARLTASSETHDKAVQFHQMFLVQQECNNLNPPMDIPSRQLCFENEAIVTRLGMPPIDPFQQRNPMDPYGLQRSRLNKPKKGLNDCIAMLKNKLVTSPSEVSTEHISVQCGGDDPLYPTPDPISTLPSDNCNEDVTSKPAQVFSRQSTVLDSSADAFYESQIVIPTRIINEVLDIAKITNTVAPKVPNACETKQAKTEVNKRQRPIRRRAAIQKTKAVTARKNIAPPQKADTLLQDQRHQELLLKEYQDLLMFKSVKAKTAQRQNKRSQSSKQYNAANNRFDIQTIQHLLETNQRLTQVNPQSCPQICGIDIRESYNMHASADRLQEAYCSFPSARKDKVATSTSSLENRIPNSTFLPLNTEHRRLSGFSETSIICEGYPERRLCQDGPEVVYSSHNVPSIHPQILPPHTSSIQPIATSPLDLSGRQHSLVPSDTIVMGQYNCYGTLDLSSKTTEHMSTVHENDVDLTHTVVDLRVRSSDMTEQELLELADYNTPTDLSLSSKHRNRMSNIEDEPQVQDLSVRRDYYSTENDLMPIDLASPTDLSNKGQKYVLRDNNQSRYHYKVDEVYPSHMQYETSCIRHIEVNKEMDNVEHSQTLTEMQTYHNEQSASLPLSNNTDVQTSYIYNNATNTMPSCTLKLLHYDNTTSTQSKETSVGTIQPEVPLQTIGKSNNYVIHSPQKSAQNSSYDLNLNISAKPDKPGRQSKYEEKNVDVTTCQAASLCFQKVSSTVTAIKPSLQFKEDEIIEINSESMSPSPIDNNYVKDGTDQDPDTAKKIAMLPKELVEILGTMPAGHRKQLLNVLPQYVSKSSNAEANQEELELPETPKSIHVDNDDNNFKLSQLSPSHNSDTLFSPIVECTIKHPNVQPDIIHSMSSILNETPQTSTSEGYVTNTEENVTNIDYDTANCSVTTNQSYLDLSAKDNVSNDMPQLTKDKVTPFVQTTRQRGNNEQTASLRAVRIKAPSERNKSSENSTLTKLSPNAKATKNEVSSNNDNFKKLQNFQEKNHAEIVVISSQNDENMSATMNTSEKIYTSECIEMNGISANNSIKLYEVDNNSNTVNDSNPQIISSNKSKENALNVILDRKDFHTKLNSKETKISDTDTNKNSTMEKVIRKDVYETANNEDDSDDDLSLAVIVKQKEQDKKKLTIATEKLPKKCIHSRKTMEEENSFLNQNDSAVSTESTKSYRIYSEADSTVKDDVTFKNILNAKLDNIVPSLPGTNEIAEMIKSSRINKSKIDRTTNLNEKQNIYFQENINKKSNIEKETDHEKLIEKDTKLCPKAEEIKVIKKFSEIDGSQNQNTVVEDVVITDKHKSDKYNVKQNEKKTQENLNVKLAEEKNITAPCYATFDKNKLLDTNKHQGNADPYSLTELNDTSYPSTFSNKGKVSYTQESKNKKRGPRNKKNKMNEDNSNNTTPSFEIPQEPNEPTIALRRSRRGKSIITEPVLIRSESLSETRIPITKKQLIFSKLLHDEERHLKSLEKAKEVSKIRQDMEVNLAQTSFETIKSGAEEKEILHPVKNTVSTDLITKPSATRIENLEPGTKGKSAEHIVRVTETINKSMETAGKLREPCLLIKPITCVSSQTSVLALDPNLATKEPSSNKTDTKLPANKLCVNTNTYIETMTNDKIARTDTDISNSKVIKNQDVSDKTLKNDIVNSTKTSKKPTTTSVSLKSIETSIKVKEKCQEINDRNKSTKLSAKIFEPVAPDFEPCDLNLEGNTGDNKAQGCKKGKGKGKRKKSPHIIKSKNKKNKSCESTNIQQMAKTSNMEHESFETTDHIESSKDIFNRINERCPNLSKEDCNLEDNNTDSCQNNEDSHVNIKSKITNQQLIAMEPALKLNDCVEKRKLDDLENHKCFKSKKLKAGTSAIESNKNGKEIQQQITADRKKISFKTSTPARRTRSKSVIEKSTTQTYSLDPYDLDFEDPNESKEPLLTTRQKEKVNHEVALKIIPTTSSDCTSTKNEDYKECISKRIHLDFKCSDSDSDDSSKSDVPLKKYVEEKESKIAREKLQPIAGCSHDIDTSEITERQVSTEGTKNNKKGGKKRTKSATNTTEDVSKNTTKTKTDEQLRSEKFMESFGFFSERKPRKSNLIASKKISETFHVIANESEDIDSHNRNRHRRASQSHSSTTTERPSSSKEPNVSKKRGKRGRKKKRSASYTPPYCQLCKKEFRRPDNYYRHQITLLHIARLSEVELKIKTAPVPEEPNYLIAYKLHLDKLRALTQKLAKRKKNSRLPKIKLPTMAEILDEVNRTVREQQLARRGLSRDEALFVDCCELLKESHKTEGAKRSTNKVSTTPEFYLCPGHPHESEYLGLDEYRTDDKKDCTSDGDVDSITAKNILESEEVRNLENDLISGLKEAANANSLKKAAEYVQTISNTSVNDISYVEGVNFSHSTLEPNCQQIVSIDAGVSEKQEHNSPVFITETDQNRIIVDNELQKKSEEPEQDNYDKFEDSAYSCHEEVVDTADEINNKNISQHDAEDSDLNLVNNAQEKETIKKKQKKVTKPKNKHKNQSKKKSKKRSQQRKISENSSCDDNASDDKRDVESKNKKNKHLQSKKDKGLDHFIDKEPKCKQDKKTNGDKTKTIKYPEYKEKMYPDVIEDIDMFEDKFDKIKRKSRSQAVAAKHSQNAVNPCSSTKTRKTIEKKKIKKSSKKSMILTKGALKGFDGIKVSIPTSDINVSAIVAPFEIALKKKKNKEISKKRKTKTITESNCKYDSNQSVKEGSSQKKIDVYEFLDEDTELFEFRPSTLMERFKSITSKDTPCTSKTTATVVNENSSASASDGDDFVYMSDDYVCSDDETENSLMSCETGTLKVDAKKGTKKKEVLDKNAVMGKIFKNNAVRTEKKIVKGKESLKAKANLDQLFDSLLEDEPSSSMLNDDTDSPKNSCDIVPATFVSPKNKAYRDEVNHFDKCNTTTVTDGFVTSKDLKKLLKSSRSKRRSVSPPRRRGSASPSVPTRFEYTPKKAPSDDFININLIASPSIEKSPSKHFKECFTSRIERKSLKRSIHSLSPKSDDSVGGKYESILTEGSARERVRPVRTSSPKLSEELAGTSFDLGEIFECADEESGVAGGRARRKCAVGKQNVLAESWSSETESEGERVPPRPSSAGSVVTLYGRKKRNKKKERALKKLDADGRSGARPALSWTVDAPEAPPPEQPQHGWIVGDSHKKLVTMLAHAKGRKRTEDRRHLIE